MPATLPEPVQFLAALDTYLAIAYDKVPTTTVKSQVETLRAWPAKFYEAPVFARIGEPILRYSMRLGNRYYPHMKLVLELSPAGDRFLFKADTHDRHICPLPTSPEYAGFCELMTKNQQLAEKIEAAWAAMGISTFKTYLQEDLARRAAKGA